MPPASVPEPRTAGTTNSGKNVEGLMRAARAHLVEHGQEISQSKLSRLVRNYQASGTRNHHNITRWLETRTMARTKDPTADTAVRNVTRGGH